MGNGSRKNRALRRPSPTGRVASGFVQRTMLPMSERQARTEAPQRASQPAPFEFEDRTTPEFEALRAEAYLLRKWVLAEREAGRHPN